MTRFSAINTLNPDFIDQPSDTLWSYISPLYMIDESFWLKELLPLAQASDTENIKIRSLTHELITRVRADKNAIHLIDALLMEYSLDTQEGITLMCLAEALMRIPDSKTADALIKDKLTSAHWKSHLNHSDSIFVNASTWGLLLTGKVVNIDTSQDNNTGNMINRLVNKMTEPLIRQAMHQAMKIIAQQFVLGRNIEEAQKNATPLTAQGISYSYDMLGESVLTQHDATKYFNAYMQAIQSVGGHQLNRQNKNNAATVSIKLSALHPRYDVANKQRVLTEMFECVLRLIHHARQLNVGLTIDAEEADRLELSLQLFAKLYHHPISQGWGKLGFVVQAYSKRALAVLTWLAAIAKKQGDCIPLRLVKGAYWDSEIKLSQQNGYQAYPVYTRKEGTDVAYLACARFLLCDHIKGVIYPQFASHNAHTIVAISTMVSHKQFEFQRLHGMGDALYQHVAKMFTHHVRIYAPVGNHKDLLPYLVRRLLENGANSSFVHRLFDAKCPIDILTQHPVDTLTKRSTLHNGLIPLPPAIFQDRKKADAININITSESQPFEKQVALHMQSYWRAGAIIDGKKYYQSDNTAPHIIYAAYDNKLNVGSVLFTDSRLVEQAIASAYQYVTQWQQTSLDERAKSLLNLADLLEKNMTELVALCHKEAGKTVHDSIDEVREAVDFCRYYAHQAKQNFKQVQHIKRFDGVKQQLKMQGKGVFVCISPWNFPLAIFIGQISAALVTGNTVLAKPAEQTSLIAARAVELMLEAGVPTGAIHLLPGTGDKVGALLTSDSRVVAVVFTGSIATAQEINRSLATRHTTIATLIAETGGQNAMIVDSSALPEQVVKDVIRSAFSSAGQRCSALRVLYLQEEIADRMIELIQGAMQELTVAQPYLHATDIGPVIDHEAKNKLNSYIKNMLKDNKLIAQVILDKNCHLGSFVAPTAIEINNLAQLEGEQFGPILHIIRFKSGQLQQVIKQINNTGFGLTLAIHSRNEACYLRLASQIRVGNCYINRDQVGAMVGVQPFGGQGLSGTGPKAGGPRYLYRFVNQLTENIM